MKHLFGEVRSFLCDLATKLFDNAPFFKNLPSTTAGIPHLFHHHVKNTNILAAISFGLIAKGAEALLNSDEFINDPRHPRFAKGGKFIDLEKRD